MVTIPLRKLHFKAAKKILLQFQAQAQLAASVESLLYAKSAENSALACAVILEALFRRITRKFVSWKSYLLEQLTMQKFRSEIEKPRGLAACGF